MIPLSRDLNKFTLCLITLLFLTPTIFRAQERVLKGYITNQKDVQGIHILNTSSRFNTITNALGEFEIRANLNDTLLVSSVTYVPEQLVVSQEWYDDGIKSITLKELVNELDEVFLGPQLTGDLERDLKKIAVEDQINFDDVGIPGFQGNPEEKIPKMIGQVITPLAVNVEGLYKHLSGYYKKLRLQRKWEKQNVTASQLIFQYTPVFFEEAYGIPQDRLYDFVLFCLETSDIQRHFKKENYALVVSIFDAKGKEYTLRLQEKKE